MARPSEVRLTPVCLAPALTPARGRVQPWVRPGLVLTVFVGADDHGRALGPWSHLCVSHGGDTVLRPFLQSFQKDLSGGRGYVVHLLGVRVL